MRLLKALYTNQAISLGDRDTPRTPRSSLKIRHALQTFSKIKACYNFSPAVCPGHCGSQPAEGEIGDTSGCHQ